MYDLANDTHPLITRIETALANARFIRPSIMASGSYVVSLTFPVIDFKKRTLSLKTAARAFHDNNQNTTFAVGKTIFEDKMISPSGLFQKLAACGLRTHKESVLVIYNGVSRGAATRPEVMIMQFHTKQETHIAVDAIKHGYA